MFELPKIPYAMNTKLSSNGERLTNIQHTGSPEV
jgi:hypothetical protein